MKHKIKSEKIQTFARRFVPKKIGLRYEDKLMELNLSPRGKKKQRVHDPNIQDTERNRRGE